MKRLTKFLISVFTGAMFLGMTAFASEYSVTPANAVFYTNGETVVLADAAENAQVILPECEAGLPIQVTGVTSNGYWQIVLGDATYYVVGAGLSQTAESTEEVAANTPAQPVAKSTSSEAFPYELNKVHDNGTIAWVYFLDVNRYSNDEEWAAWYACSDYNHARFSMVDGVRTNGNINFEEACLAAGSTDSSYPPRCSTPWTVGGEKVVMCFCW